MAAGKLSLSARKKKYRRKRRTYRFILKHTKSPMPPKFYTKMRYCTRCNIDPGASSAVAAHVFNANGLYDPDLTAAGHQPRGFDELMAFYDHYTVLYSKISAMFYNSNGSMGIIVGIATRDASAVEASIEDYTEQSTCRIKYMNPDECQALSVSQNISKFTGLNKFNDALRGTTSGNPTEDVLFHVFASPIRSAQDSSVIACYVTIDYLCCLTELKDLVQS